MIQMGMEAQSPFSKIFFSRELIFADYPKSAKISTIKVGHQANLV